MEGSTIAAMYMKGLAKQYHFSWIHRSAIFLEEVVDILLYGTKGEKIDSGDVPMNTVLGKY